LVAEVSADEFRRAGDQFHPPSPQSTTADRLRCLVKHWVISWHAYDLAWLVMTRTPSPLAYHPQLSPASWGSCHCSLRPYPLCGTIGLHTAESIGRGVVGRMLAEEIGPLLLGATVGALLSLVPGVNLDTVR